MLSNLIILPQRFVLVIDELGQEKISQKIICQLLREQGQEESTIKTLARSNALRTEATFDAFVNECATDNGLGDQQKRNVLLPTLSDLLCYQRPAVVFQFLHKLRKCPQVQRIFLWASIPHIAQQFVVAACAYMAEVVLHLETQTKLSIITRKPGGGVTNKCYDYKCDKQQFVVELQKHSKNMEKENPEPTKTESLGTFKIDLEEDELVARNMLKLPYERTTNAAEEGGNIIYTPDAADDFDDEDPDEDLCI